MGLRAVITHGSAVSCGRACRSSCKDLRSRARRGTAPMKESMDPRQLRAIGCAHRGRARRPVAPRRSPTTARSATARRSTSRASPRRSATRRPASRAGVPEADRAWIEAAIASARPEAQRLIAEVDGLVEYQVHRGRPARRHPLGDRAGRRELRDLLRHRARSTAAARQDRDGRRCCTSTGTRSTSRSSREELNDRARGGHPAHRRLRRLRRRARRARAPSRPSASPTRSPSGRCAAASRPWARATRSRTRPRWRAGARRWRPWRTSSPRRASAGAAGGPPCRPRP